MARTSTKAETLTPGKLKAFKTSELMESFYRNVHENGLREEALSLLKYALETHYSKPKTRRRKAKTLQ